MKTIKVYYANICDHKGTPVVPTKYYATNRQAAAVAQKLIEEIPPAIGLEVKCKTFKLTYIAELLNEAPL